MKKTKVTEKQEKAKEQILKTAKTLFASKGFFEVSVNMIAKQAGVAKGLIYYYFKDKKDILGCLVDETIADVIELGAELQKHPHDHLALKGRQSFGHTNFDQIDQVLKKHSEIIRIILMEVLKGHMPIQFILDTVSRCIGEFVPADLMEDYRKLNENPTLRSLWFFYYILPKISSHSMIGLWEAQNQDLNSRELFDALIDVEIQIEQQVVSKKIAEVVDQTGLENNRFFDFITKL